MTPFAFAQSQQSLDPIHKAMQLLPIRPALDDTLEGGIVVLEGDLASSLIQISVSLDEHLSGLLVLQDDVPDLGSPVFQADAGHIGEELGTVLDISGRLVDVDLLEEISDSCANS